MYKIYCKHIFVYISPCCFNRGSSFVTEVFPQKKREKKRKKMSPANWGACYRSFSATLSGREKDFSNWFALNSRKGRKRGHDAPKLDQPPAGSDHRRGRPRPGYPSKGLRERTNQSARCLPSGRRSSFPSPRSQESNQGLWGCWRRQWEASHTTSIRTECYFSSLLHWRRVRPHEAGWV